MNVALNYYLALIYPYLLISFKILRTVYFSRLIKINKKTSCPESSVLPDILHTDKKCHSFHLKNVHFRILLNLVVLKTFGSFPRKYPCLESFYHKIALTNQSHCFKGYLWTTASVELGCFWRSTRSYRNFFRYYFFTA